MIETLETLKRRHLLRAVMHGKGKSVTVKQAAAEAGYTSEEAWAELLAAGWKGGANYMFSLWKRCSRDGCTYLVLRFHLGRNHKVRWFINLTFWRTSKMPGFDLFCKAAEARQVAA